MSNPYLDEFLAAPVDEVFSGFEFGRMERWLARGERERLRTKYAYAIPDDAAVRGLVELSPSVEIGAGTGYWASLVFAAGGDIVCYDVAPYKNHWVEGRWHPVNVGGPESAAKHPYRALFLCWPPYDKPMAVEALAAYQGRHVVYIGEGQGGCTGDDSFHDALEKGWRELRVLPLWQFGGIHDQMFVYERIGKPHSVSKGDAHAES